MRAWLVIFHRYVGLVMAFFLVIAGSTGTLLAFYAELDAAVNASVMYIDVSHNTPGIAQPLDPLELRERLARQFPQAEVNYANLHYEAGKSVSVWLEGAADPVTGEHADLGNDEFFVHPYTGEVLGARQWGDISQGLTNLMPFIYRLHYSLALETVGSYVFGIIALLWTIDCFVGGWLTFPPTPSRNRKTGKSVTGKSRSAQWWLRWRQAWKVRWTGGSYKLNFDLHRAGGLWVWAMLLVLAWSSVAFNLDEVYSPVMRVLLPMQAAAVAPPLPDEQAEPGISWHEARRIGRMLIATEAQQKGFIVRGERSLSYDPHTAMYYYSVNSDRDLSELSGGTAVYFDANSGEKRGVFLPTGEAAGDTVTTWLLALHMAQVWGMPFRIFVSAMGLLVVMLSITGIIIWWRKRRAVLLLKARQTRGP